MDSDSPKQLIPREKPDENTEVTFNHRMPKKDVDEFKETVAEKKLSNPKTSMKQELLEMMRQVNDGRDYASLELKNQVLEHENQELRKLTTKKIPTHKRVSVPFTKEEFDILYEEAARLQMTVPQYLQQFFKNKHPILIDNSIPQLE